MNSIEKGMLEKKENEFKFNSVKVKVYKQTTVGVNLKESLIVTFTM